MQFIVLEFYCTMRLKWKCNLIPCIKKQNQMIFKFRKDRFSAVSFFFPLRDATSWKVEGRERVERIMAAGWNTSYCCFSMHLARDQGLWTPTSPSACRYFFNLRFFTITFGGWRWKKDPSCSASCSWASQNHLGARALHGAK